MHQKRHASKKTCFKVILTITYKNDTKTFKNEK